MHNEKLPNVTWLSLGLAYLSVAFQLGYFQRIGIEFISHVGSSDIITSIAFMSSILVSIVGVYVMASSYLSMTSLHRFWKEIIIWGVASAAVVLAIALAEAGEPSGRSLFQIINDAFWICILLLLAMFYVSDAQERIVADEEIGLRTVLLLVFLTGILMVMAGRLYATYAGSKCNLILRSNAVMEASYLRAIGNGHLVKLGERAVFLNSEEVLQVSCRRPELGP